MSVVTLPDVRAHLNLNGADHTYDTEIQGFIDAATAIIGYETGPLVPTTYTESYTPRGSRLVLDHVPVISITTLTEYLTGVSFHTLTSQPLGSTVDNYGYSLDLPESGLVVRRGASGWEMPFWGPVVVTYQAGLSAIPADLRMAVLEDIRGLWQQTQQGSRPAFGTGGASPDAWASTPFSTFPRLSAILDGSKRTQSLA